MSDDIQTIQEKKINSLLIEYDDHRDAIKNMIVDLEKIREKIDKLIPDTLEARYVRFFEEKIKTITALFNSLLEMRKEIAKSVKDEIDIRRRIKDQNDMVDLDGLLDVRKMADTIEKFKKSTDVIKRKRINKNKEQTVDEKIEIPGITSEIGGGLINDQ